MLVHHPCQVVQVIAELSHIDAELDQRVLVLPSADRRFNLGIVHAKVITSHRARSVEVVQARRDSLQQLRRRCLHFIRVSVSATNCSRGGSEIN